MSGRYADVGILTFHCANDYGAMLQTYALKNYLCGNGIPTDIVRYEPPFMTGRYWWIPYVPSRNPAKTLWRTWNGWKNHCSMGIHFFDMKKYMENFREHYLVNRDHKKLIFSSQLQKLPYRYYIVGSDQIWNPVITCGLRKEYFGGFRCKNKQKVIAYAASLGGEALSPVYAKKFSRFINCVDAVSVREKEAVPYVEQFYKKRVLAVCDPVFLLDQKDWIRVEKKPDRKGYILVYGTQENKELTNYVKMLSQNKGLPVVELRNGTSSAGEKFRVDYSTGPAEFLGYIHNADYVVTNSFHAASFSIIYQKKFMVFLHRGRGARLRNILMWNGLESRLYQENTAAEIDTEIDWTEVKQRRADHVRSSKDFLEKHCGGVRNEKV